VVLTWTFKAIEHISGSRNYIKLNGTIINSSRKAKAVDNEYPERIELRQRMFRVTRAQRRFLKLLGVMMVLVIVAVLFALFEKMDTSGKSWSKVFHFIYERFHRDPLRGLLHVLLLVVLVLQLAYLLSAFIRERLVLSTECIRYVSSMPTWLQFLLPGWLLRWDQIQSASLAFAGLGRGPRGPMLILEGPGQKRRIFPWLWVDDATPVDNSFTKEWRRLAANGPAAVETAVECSHLMRYLAAARPDLQINRTSANAGTMFALESNRQALVVVIAFFVFAFYALIDGLFIRSEVYVDTPFYATYTLVGFLFAIIAWRWMGHGKVPKTEAVVLALLLGISTAAAAYPGALRVNAISDTGGLQTYKYTRAENGDYRSSNAKLPDLSFSDYPEYWSQFAEGSEYEFQLRKGGLGFYQLNMKPVKAAMREYYSTHDS